MSRRGIPETVKLVHEQEDLITDLRRRLDAAEARALTAEHEVEVVREERVKYGNGYYVENARAEMATARAERAEAAEADLLAKLGEYEHAITWNVTCFRCANQLDAAYAETVRRELAEEAVERVRALAAEFQSERPSKIANVQFVASAILAALDAQRPAEGGPELLDEAEEDPPNPIERPPGRPVTLIITNRADSTTPPPSPSEPPDETYVIVRSIKASRPLVSLYRLSSGIWQRDGNGAVATWDELVEWDEMHCPVPVGPLPEQVLGFDDDPPSPEGEGANPTVRCRCDDCEEQRAAALDGGQPDTPAPGPARCPQCHLQPIADGYSVCELCAYSPRALDAERPAVVPATAVVSAPVAANPQTDSVTPDTPAPTEDTP